MLSPVGEEWTTRAEIDAAADRFRAGIPGWSAPAAYAVGTVSSDRVTFPVFNVGAHGLPALVLATVCGHRAGTATIALSRAQLHEAIDRLAPAGACPDFEHPNLAAWQELAQGNGDLVAVFLDSLAPADATDPPQRRLAELAAVQSLPVELSLELVPEALAALDRATTRLVAAVRDRPESLEEPSRLPGWSRRNVLAHLRYVAEAMERMTVAAVAGDASRQDMYPGGRDVVRPATLDLRPGETVHALVDSLEQSAASLLALWWRLPTSAWETRLVDRDLGEVALRRLVALRLTEVEVHGVDLGLPELDAWSDALVDLLLPLRVAWLPTARRRPDAGLGIGGSWVLTDGDQAWLVQADGTDVEVGVVAAQRTAMCWFIGPRRELLALILGRNHTVERRGLPELAEGFKTAFPGP